MLEHKKIYTSIEKWRPESIVELKPTMTDVANNDTDEPQWPAEPAVPVPISLSSGGPQASDKATIAKLSAQLKRLNDANGKYKNLLKLAKERIEKQEEETNTLKLENAQLSERILEFEEKEALWALNATTVPGNGSTNDEFGDSNRNTALQSASGVESSILRICQRTQNKLSDGSSEIWALVEMQSTAEDGSNSRRYKEWKRFETESQLQDYIRLETGEPIVLPPYALSQEQSRLIQEQAEQQISKVNDEFRRFRVKAELARKQSESLIRELQASLTQKVAQQIQNGNEDSLGHTFISSDMTEAEQVRALTNQLDRVKRDVTAQESKWKQSYEALVAENNALKSSGSQVSLVDQWRKRYEQCLKENDDLEKRIKFSSPTVEANNEYEAKYKDLKGSNKMVEQ